MLIIDDRATLPPILLAVIVVGGGGVGVICVGLILMLDGVF